MAKFTQEQIEQATAEFLVGENAEWSTVKIPGAGNNGSILIYQKVEKDNGTNQGPSD